MAFHNFLDLLNLQPFNFQGFFVEAGAFDGATDSTSLHFEIAHQWSGLLIEPVSRFFSSRWGFTLAHGAGLEFFPLSSSCFEVHFLALRFKELRWRQSSKKPLFQVFCQNCGERPTRLVGKYLPLDDNPTSNCQLV